MKLQYTECYQNQPYPIVLGDICVKRMRIFAGFSAEEASNDGDVWRRDVIRNFIQKAKVIV